MKTHCILPALVALTCLAVRLDAHVLGGVANWADLNASSSVGSLNASINGSSPLPAVFPIQNLSASQSAIPFAVPLPGTDSCRDALGDHHPRCEDGPDERHGYDDGRNRFDGDCRSAQIPEPSGTSLGLGVVVLTGILLVRRHVTVRA